MRPPRERLVDGPIHGSGRSDESTMAECGDGKNKVDSDIDMDQREEGTEAKGGAKEDEDNVMSDAKDATGAQDDGRERNIILTTSIDGNAFVWDRRVPNGVARKLLLPDRTPPWCLSVSFVHRRLSLCAWRVYINVQENKEFSGKEDNLYAD